MPQKEESMMDWDEAMELIEEVLDTLIEVGNGVKDEDLHRAADYLFKARDILESIQAAEESDGTESTFMPNADAPTETVIWEDDFGEGGTGYAKCPKCHELAYGMVNPDENGVGQCPFCGQHYQLDEEGRKKAEPNPEETIVCPNCGKKTLVGGRAKSNGHFHGICTNCGCWIME